MTKIEKSNTQKHNAPSTIQNTIDVQVEKADYRLSDAGRETLANLRDTLSGWNNKIVPHAVKALEQGRLDGSTIGAKSADAALTVLGAIADPQTATQRIGQATQEQINKVLISTEKTISTSKDFAAETIQSIANPLREFAKSAWSRISELKNTVQTFAEDGKSVAASIQKDLIGSLNACRVSIHENVAMAIDGVRARFELVRRQCDNVRYAASLDSPIGGYKEFDNRTILATLRQVSPEGDKTLRDVYKQSISEFRSAIVDRIEDSHKKGGLHSRQVVADDFTLGARELLRDQAWTANSVALIVSAICEGRWQPAEDYLKSLVSKIPTTGSYSTNKKDFEAKLGRSGIFELSEAEITTMVWVANRSVIGNLDTV